MINNALALRDIKAESIEWRQLPQQPFSNLSCDGVTYRLAGPSKCHQKWTKLTIFGILKSEF